MVIAPSRLMLSCLILVVGLPNLFAQERKTAKLIRSARGGDWSAPGTWAGGKVPGTGVKVQIRQDHVVRYDLKSDVIIRSIHVAGTLTFAHDKDTRLCTGLIKVQPGDDTSEDGFDCSAHLPKRKATQQPTLSVGTPDRPITSNCTALIRLVSVPGMNKESCPAIVCCGGQMDFHGAPLSRTWVKLSATTKIGDKSIVLAEPVTGWRSGDQIILTGTTRQHKPSKTFRASVRDRTQTEERQIRSIDGVKLVLDRPLEYEHKGTGAYRGEAANLSRNVVVESGDPKTVRAATPCITATRPVRSATPSSATWARRACLADTACTTTCAATRCAAVP